jgi:hypothetical protein
MRRGYVVCLAVVGALALAGTLADMLPRAGMTYDSYQSYLGALSMAKSDAADPSSLEMSVDTASLPAEQAEAIALLGAGKNLGLK